MNAHDGGPAFPGGVNSVYTDIDPGQPTQAGMTLRDYFAAKVLATLVDAFPSAAANCIASRAYEYADAMLAARAALSKATGG